MQGILCKRCLSSLGQRGRIPPGTVSPSSTNPDTPSPSTPAGRSRRKDIRLPLGEEGTEIILLPQHRINLPSPKSHPEHLLDVCLWEEDRGLLWSSTGLGDHSSCVSEGLCSLRGVGPSPGEMGAPRTGCCTPRGRSLLLPPLPAVRSRVCHLPELSPFHPRAQAHLLG